MINFFRKKLNKKGFTLVELLIVIAVLGIIAGIGINSMTGITDTFKIKADQETGRMLARSVEVNILAGQIVSGSSTVVADAQKIIAKDTETPQTGGTFEVDSINFSTGKIVITFGEDGDEKVTVDIATDAVK